MRPAVREHFLEMGIPIFSSKNLPVQRINKMPFVRPEDVGCPAAWEEEMKDRLARLQEERLESLFQEYRVERKKEEKRKQKLARMSRLQKQFGLRTRNLSLGCFPKSYESRLKIFSYFL